MAKEVATKSIVLLQNKNSLLPLPKDARSVAIIGPLADKVKPAKLQTVDFLLLTISLVILIFARSAPVFYIFAFVFGFARQGAGLLQTLTGIEILGVKNFGSYIGTFLLFGTTGGMVGTPVAGFIFDATGSYTTAFWMGVAAAGLAVFVSSLLLRHKTSEM